MNTQLIIYYGYLAISIILPILYLISYKRYKSKHKNWGKAFLIAFLMLFLFMSVKGIAYLFNNDSLNCYLNNVCPLKNEDDDKTQKKTKEKKTNTTTTTTTKKIEEKKYKKIEEPSGEKKLIGKSSKGYDIYSIDGVTYVDGYLIANKTYPLPEDFIPKNTKSTPTDLSKVCNNCINIQAYDAFEDMKADAQAVGLKLWNQSGFRSFKVQGILYNNYIKREQAKGLNYEAAKAEADTYSARPGYSEHQSGECFDLNNAGRNFNGTKEALWVAQNAAKYGFILRYPEGKTNETGYIYESWHLRYVGEDLASKLFNNGDWITMESYFGLTSKYAE